MQMTKVEERKFKKAYDDWFYTETSTGLKKVRLTFAEWNIVGNMLMNILNQGYGTTFITDVAKWFERRKFYVKMYDHNVNYLIALNENHAPAFVEMEDTDEGSIGLRYQL